MAARALTGQAVAKGILHFHAELHGRQPWADVFTMEVDRAALQHRTNASGLVVLAVTRAPAVEIESRFDFPQAVVDAVNNTRVGNAGP